MAGFENLTVEELKMLAELRYVDCYENMSRQQRESNILHATRSVSEPTSKPKPKPKSASKATKKSTPKASGKSKT